MAARTCLKLSTVNVKCLPIVEYFSTCFHNRNFNHFKIHGCSHYTNAWKIKRNFSNYQVVFCNSSYDKPQKSVKGELNSSQDHDYTDDNDILIEDIISVRHSPKLTTARQGHNFLVIQPKFKWLSERNHLTTPDLQLEEAVSLVKTLPFSRVVDSCIYTLKNSRKKFVYGKGTFQDITERIKEQPLIDAVFVSIEMLSGIQYKELENAWKVKVYDRYRIVLEIFRAHARTREAKLQITLAEIPYIRSRLRNNVEKLDQQSGRQNYISGGGETLLEIKQRLLSEREVKIKKALALLQRKRCLLRSNRQKKQMPTISVVGYTNAGKTSLIRSLTGDISVQPEDKLFATLDVTNHAGYLPNNMQVLYVDTVGFLSSLPHSLIASFSATLEDVVLSDLIIHVQDISHPEYESQKQNVLRVLNQLNVPSHLMQHMIEVNNKADKVNDRNFEKGVCAIDGTGVDELKLEIQQKLLNISDIIRIELDIPMAGPHLRWLYKEATVESTSPSLTSSENMLVVTVLNNKIYAKFKNKFGNLERAI